MTRAAACLLAFAMMQTISSSSVFAQCSCAAPSCAAPSCAAPACVGFSCDMPACMPSCAAPGGCSTCQPAHHCSTCNEGKGCKGRWINIDLSRKITKGEKVKRNNFLGGFGGEAPPQGFVASSQPVINFSAVAAVPLTTMSASSASVSKSDLRDMIEEMMDKKASASAASAGSSKKCEDPCGDIRQLQDDVAQLKEITVNLTNVVNKLVDNAQPAK